MSRTFKRKPGLDQDLYDQVSRATVRRQARRLAEIAWGRAAIADPRLPRALNSCAHALEMDVLYGDK